MGGVTRDTPIDVESVEINSIRGSGPIVTLPPDPKYRAYYLLDNQLEELADSGNSTHFKLCVDFNWSIFYCINNAHGWRPISTTPTVSLSHV